MTVALRRRHAGHRSSHRPGQHPLTTRHPVAAATARMIATLCLLAGGTAAPGALQAAALQWDGTGPNSNFSAKNGFTGFTNWRILGNGPAPNVLPANGDSLTFAGGARLTPTNDLTNLSLSGLAFASNAGAFTLGGNGLTLAGHFSNASAAAQRINLAVTVGSDQTWTDTGGGSTFAGIVTLGNRALTLTGGITLDNPTQELLVGSTGTGSLVLNSGARVNGLRGTIGNSAGAAGTATLNGGATWTTTDRFHVGLSGNGSLLVQGGGRIDAAESYISYFGSSTSTATVTGIGSTWASSADLKIGVTGNATLEVRDGGQVTNRDGYLGYVTGAQALVVIGGTDAAWRNSRHLTVGLASGTSSRIQVGNGGLVEAGGQLTLNAGGTVQLFSGGTLRADTASRNGGSFEWNGGVLDLGTLNLGAAGSLLGKDAAVGTGQTLRIGQALTVGSGSLAVAAGGVLDIADNASFAGSVANNGSWVLRAGTYGNTATGTGTLTKQGAGTVVYTGNGGQNGAAVLQGTLQLGNGSAAGSLGGDVAVGPGTVLRLNQPGTTSLGGRLTGQGGLQTIGAGTTQFMGSAGMLGSTTHTFDATSTEFSGGGLFDLGLATLLIAGDPASVRTQSAMRISNATVKAVGLDLATQARSGAPTGLLAVQGSTAQLIASGTVRIGVAARGVLDVRDGGSVQAGSLEIGGNNAQALASVSGAGSVVAAGRSGGALRVGGGSGASLQVVQGALVEAGNLFVGAVGSGATDVTLGTGGRLVTSGNVRVGVGNGGTADVRLSGGASFDSTSNVSVGNSSTQQATVQLQGTGTTWTATEVDLGVNGRGTVSVATGSVFSVGDLAIGNSGTLTLAGGTLRTDSASRSALGSFDWRSGTLVHGAIDNASFDAFFRSPITLTAGQTWQAGDSGRTWTIDGGRVTIDGGTLALAHTGQLDNAAPFTWRSGTLAFTAGNDIRLANDAYFSSPLLMLTTGQTLRTSGQLYIDPGTAVLLAGGRLQAGTVRLEGGQIFGLGSQTLDMADVGELRGFGTVAAAVKGGTSESWISAVRTVLPPTPDVAPGVGGAADRATLVLGDAHRSDGFQYDGRMGAENARVILLSGGPAGLGLSTSLSDSRLEAGAGLELAAGRTLVFSGRNEVLGSFHNQGQVQVDGEATSPDRPSSLTFLSDVSGSGGFAGDIVFQAGYSPGNSPASVSFGGGRVVFGSHAVLTLEIGGPLAGTQHDQLLDIGELTFDGQLVLSFVGGYAPTPGTRLQLLQFGSLSGHGLDAGQVRVTGLDGRQLDLGSLASGGFVTSVPEPGTWALWLGGLAALGGLVRRRAATA